MGEETLRQSPRWENRTDLGLTVRTERREALQGNLCGPAGARRQDGGRTGVPPLVSSAGAALGPQLHEPRARTKRGGGRRLKRGGGRSGDVS